MRVEQIVEATLFASQTPLTAIAVTKIAQQVCVDNDVDPDNVGLNAVLVDPRDPLAIADGIERNHHTASFNIDEQVLPLGSAILAETARRFVTGAVKIS